MGGSSSRPRLGFAPRPTMSLEPIAPKRALTLYLDDRENNLSQATVYSHRSRLGHFVRWCNANGIENLNELSGRQLQEFRIWRRTEDDLSPVTEKTQMDTLRVFIRWLESMDGVEQDLHSKVRSPTLRKDENVRNEMLDSEQAEAVLRYLKKFEYASRPHVVISLMWHTMMRVGGIHALDVDDYSSDSQTLEVVHRPEIQTALKNAELGERFIALSGEICGLLDVLIETTRPDSSDEYGREPLLASEVGRAHRSTLRSDCYRYTRPCIYANECPHGRVIEDCEARGYESASECPSSSSPHMLRRGGLTHALNGSYPIRPLGDRADVDPLTLSEHYDQRTKREKMEQRRKFLDNI